MGLIKKDRITYLRISDGKIRAKSVKEDPDAEERFVEIKGIHVYEKVYKSCEGYLIDITVQTHEEYGVTYNLVLFDPFDGMKYSLAIAESSRYFGSLVQHIPNIDFAQKLTVKPYAFTVDGRRNLGISFLQNGVKVENYYREYNEDTETSKSKNGLEKFNFAKVKKSKEDTKIMQMQLLKFLKAELKPYLIKLKKYMEDNQLPITETTDEEEPTDSSNTPSKNKRSSQNKKSSKKAGKKNQDNNEDDLPY